MIFSRVPVPRSNKRRYDRAIQDMCRFRTRRRRSSAKPSAASPPRAAYWQLCSLSTTAGDQRIARFSRALPILSSREIQNMEHILFDVHEHVGTITLNRPEKLNAVTPEMSDALVAHVQEWNRRDDVHVMVLLAAGEKAFCAGSDIKDLDNYKTPWELRTRTD